MELWEDIFSKKQEIWGFNPCKSAVITKNCFIKNNINNVLIPGIGYGRNAKPFVENNIKTTGIEISKTALEIAKKYYDDKISFYHGSVINMPFSNHTYSGIFCHALIHLLNKKEREKLLKDCYQQLSKNGLMFFSVINKKANNYGKGKYVSKDCYEFHKGIPIFYYDKESIAIEFKDFNVFDIKEVLEDQPMYLIMCKK